MSPAFPRKLYQAVGLWIPLFGQSCLESVMSNFVPFHRDQCFLLPPDLKEWLPADDVAHFIVAAVDRVTMASFQVPDRSGGKPQYHPRLMLAQGSAHPA
jgi:hypothetical protein